MCSVDGCENPAVRSISLERYRESKIGLKLKENTKRVYLCREHYKEFKKSYRKNVTKLERFFW